MGEVYLARDLALGRSVAIKVVGRGLDPALQARLLREAQACARLQHPAIATFYESGVTAESVFIAMEHVRGETLRKRLGRGRVDVADALTIGSAVLEALNHAHAAGIVHRDIKPENIMLAGPGTPKVLDFGLARMAAEAGEGGPTATNLSVDQVLGTFGYMAPEQLRLGDADPRADLFACGAVLYEMLAGRAAFRGSNAAERIAAVLSREPPALTGPGIAPELNRLVLRALSKHPGERYQTASAMLSDLRSVAAGEQGSALPETLAVIDLRNLSGQPGDDWIGSGIAESLTSDLARIPGLVVISREKLLRVGRPPACGGEAPADALEVGRLLGCRWILSGSFQRLGPVVRITTGLTDVGTGHVVAGEKLDGSIEGIFELQDRLSRTVAASLHLRVPTGRRLSPGERDVEAFEYHARARRLWQRLEKGTLEQAGDLYRRAIDLESTHAQALSGLAALHAMRFTFTTSPEELRTAAEYARRAIAADPRLAEPHVWLGYALMREDRLSEALDEFEQASELDPALVFAPYFAGCVEIFRGRPDEALPHLQRVVTLEPQHGFGWLNLGAAYCGLGQFQEGQWCCERAVALEKIQGPVATTGAAAHVAECLRLSGDLAAAREACFAAPDAVERSDHMYRDSSRGIALCVLGRVTLDQGDTAAASAALHQSVEHITGRERTLGGGHLIVQALTGLARAGDGEHHLDRATADIRVATPVQLLQALDVLGRHDPARAGPRGPCAGTRGQPHPARSRRRRRILRSTQVGRADGRPFQPQPGGRTTMLNP